MKTPIRLGIAVILILTVLWLKGNLESIQSQWQQYRTQYLRHKGEKNAGTNGTTAIPQLGSESQNAQAQEQGKGGDSLKKQGPDRVAVVGKLTEEDTEWLESLTDWQHAIYVVDDPEANPRVTQNKGRESNVYLQYILDNYHNLPSTIVFLHSHRDAWHNEFTDNTETLLHLQTDFVQRNGYANLRCNPSPGCPDEIRPFRETHDGRYSEMAFADVWNTLFNGTAVPEVAATPCCAQFAVSKAQVLKRPLSDYEHYHRWVQETDLIDNISGRVLEYMWHVIFGQNPVYCPDIWQCYSDVYGMGDNWF